MTHSMSVVQLCPDAYRDAANAIAEQAGYGPGNLSVMLQDAQGAIWWGCHAWWTPEALEGAITPPDEVPGTADILQHVTTSVREGGVPSEHWIDALAANGFTVVSQEA